MDERDNGVWRDEERLPLSELDQAMATYSADGQVDDRTGGDVGMATVLAEQAEDDEPGRAGYDRGDHDRGDPDPDSERGRRLRPSPNGHPGPV